MSTTKPNHHLKNEFASPGGGAGGEPSHDRRSINEDTIGLESPTHARLSSAENPNWDDGSFSSERKIVRTTEWRVEYQLQGNAI